MTTAATRHQTANHHHIESRLQPHSRPRSLSRKALKALTAYAKTITPGKLTPEQTVILFPPMTPLAKKGYNVLWRAIDSVLKIARAVGVIDDFTSEDGYWPTLPYRFERIIIHKNDKGSYRRYKIGRLYVNIETRGYQKGNAISRALE